MLEQKNRILVVEDNSETQLIIKVNLKEFFDLDIRDNAVASISLLRNNKFDLVLLDINLRGEFDGKYVLNEILADDSLSDIPVIIITAYDLPDEEREYLERVCCDYIEKPLGKDKLLKSIQKCLRVAKSKKSNPDN